MPLPLMVVTAIAPSDSVMAVASAAASAAPPPKINNGFLAFFNNVAAAAIASGAAAGRELFTATGTFKCSADAVITSNGNSMCTGRGRAELNTAKARASTSGSSSGRINV